MRTPNSDKDSARSFIAKAREELFALEILVANGDVARWILGFHAQQICEKCIKAVLVLWGKSPGKTHDLFQLASELQDTVQDLPDWVTEIDRLNPFAVALRYETVELAADFDAKEIFELVVEVYDWAALQVIMPTYYEFEEDDEEHEINSDLDNMPF